jgi:ATP-dependent RNA helicase DDX46/PRP5
MEDYIHRVGRTGRAGRAGTAITFITKDEERYSLDIRRALINSGNEVPEELNELCNSFKKKVESGEARVYVNQFLAGKGFKFDQEEQSKAEASKATMKKKLELEGNVAADDHSSDSGDIFLQTQKRKEVIKERTVNQKLNMIKDPVKR